MNPHVLAVAWYRFRSTFGRQWGSALSLVLLIGLIGGLALGSLAGARRTQSSFTAYLASTNPSTLDVSVYNGYAGIGPGVRYVPALPGKIRRLPGVTEVRVAAPLNGAPLAPSGAIRINTVGEAYPVASVDGLFFQQDRVTVVQGRMANANHPDEVMMTAAAAQLLGYRLGETIPYGFWTQNDENEPGFGSAKVPPPIRVGVKLVGLIQFSSGVVQDDVDRVPTLVLFTPAFAQEILPRPGLPLATAATYGIQIVGGNGAVARVERDLGRLVPSNTEYGLHAQSPVSAKADRAVKPIAIALGVFGIVTMLAALLIAAQAIGRRLYEREAEAAVLRALGAPPAVTATDGLMGIVGAVVAGGLLAVGVGWLLSPLAPLGPVRPVYPTKGFAADWAVLGGGLLVLVLGLTAFSMIQAVRRTPHRTARRARLVVAPRSMAVQSLASAGLPASGVVGMRMALETGGGRTAVPVRSALVGTVLAVALVVASITFGSSLHTLVDQPALYGWNWSYILEQTGAGSAGVPPQYAALLKHDPDVEAATDVNYNDALIDGQNVPLLFGNVGAPITPPILSGHALQGADQAVLGAATLQALHKRVGDTVIVTYGTPADAPIYVPPTRLRIVGTATMPAVGFASLIQDHTSMGTGALVPLSVIPAALQRATDSPYPTLNGPNLALVRLRPGVSPAAGRANLERIAAALNRDFAALPDNAGVGNTIVVQGVQRPAEIVDYQSIGATPDLLVSGLALGAVIAVSLTLVASVRRRQRDLALLKTLGFTQRQLAEAVAWAASAVAVIGVAVGLPIGVVLGRWLWDLFSRQIYAVPSPTVPAGSLLLVAVGAVVLANVVAAIPARRAARTPIALLFRGE
ncbi:MAG TPA: FtsX-like permease family protein [Acidimicrobiales bacterium]|jgi:hypothetical protein